MSERIDLIKNWLNKQIGALTRFEAASADASFRRYFRASFARDNRLRLSCDHTYIIMDAPPAHENIRPFIKIANILQSYSLNVPQIFASDEQLGIMVLSDLGTQSYLQQLTIDNADQLYQDAMRCLLLLWQVRPQHRAQLPVYNQNLLLQEMRLFQDWYLDQHLQYQLTTTQRQVLEQSQLSIATEILKLPQVLVHRDYHSRNLLVQSQRNPGIIDFQDAVYGPCTYDLVSLLNDSYIQWPRERVRQWLAWYYQQLQRQQLCGCSLETFQRWFALTGVQRQLKVVGIFARLNYRDGKANYLADIPLTWRNLRENCHQYGQLEDLCQLLEKIGQP